MKHFDKITCITVSLEFPEAWGNPRRIIDEVEADSFADVVWAHVCKEIKLIPVKWKADKLPPIEDITCGFDYNTITFNIWSFKDADHVDRAIQWLHDRMLEGFNTTLTQ